MPKKSDVAIGAVIGILLTTLFMKYGMDDYGSILVGGVVGYLIVVLLESNREDLKK